MLQSVPTGESIDRTEDEDTGEIACTAGFLIDVELDDGVSLSVHSERAPGSRDGRVSMWITK